MSQNHSGNMIPEITLEEHDGVNNAKRVSIVSGAVGNATVNIAGSATIYAVVNTAAAGQASVVLDASQNFIGLTSVSGFTNPLPVSQSGNWVMSVIGNMTLSDPKTFIGLTTSTLGASPAFIGITTVANRDRTITGNLTLSDPKTFIGLTSTVLGASPAFVGIVTVANRDRTILGNLTLSDPKTFIGLVTAVTRNAGTTKTLIPKNISFAQGSIATIAVPTNTYYITKILLNSNATVRVNIKSGATYLTGNASLGINLNPGGGWVEVGSPDSPVYNGLAAQAAIVLEKFDFGSVAQIGGHLMYFDE